MARTVEGRALTQLHRRQQLALRAGMLRNLVTLWSVVDPTNLSGTIGRFAAAGTVLVRAGHRDSAGLAAAYYELFRRLEGVAGQVTPLLPDALAAEVVEATLRGAGLSGIVNARRAGFSIEAAGQQGLVKVSGSAERLVLAGGRDVIDRTIRSERRAVGWMRVTGADPCSWCAMLASRGPVFKTATTAAFGFEPDQFHDHDGCEIEPVYDESARHDRSQWPETSRQLRERWDETTQGLSGADARRAFRQALEGRD